LRPDVECGPCSLKWAYERATILASEEERFQLIRSLSVVLGSEFHSNVNVGSLGNKLIRAASKFMADSAKHYHELRLQNNIAVAGMLAAARDFISGGKTPKESFERACFLAAAGNVAPISAPSGALEFSEVASVIAGKAPLPLVKGDVYQAVQNAAKILYVTDNSGEIGFDSLLIAKIKEMGPAVTIIVKEAPFFEDATLEDASFFTLDKIADNILIVEGIFTPHESTPTLANAFSQSDLVIAKGVGNYEALGGEDTEKAIINMLKIKCKPIANRLETDTGQFVVALNK
jgi:uncharacterized protein with ATP-grasp and redox domains